MNNLYFADGKDQALFDSKFYLEQNPSVADYIAELAQQGITYTAADHYLEWGAAEGLKPNKWFDAEFYFDGNPDLAAAGLTIGQALWHFAEYGEMEGRNPSPAFGEGDKIDPDLFLQYALANPDVAEYAGVTAETTELTAEQVKLLSYQFFNYGIDEDYRKGGIADLAPGAPGENDPLTEALTTLAAAEAGVSDVLASAAEAVNAAEETPLKGDALKDFIKDYDADQLADDVAAAKAAVDTVQARLDSAIATRSNARTDEFKGGVGEEHEDLVAAGIVTAGARMTDANIAAAVTKAQQGVNKDANKYLIDDSGDAQVALAVYQDANNKYFTQEAGKPVPADATILGYGYMDGSNLKDAAGNVVTVNETTGVTVASDGALVAAKNVTTAKALQTAMINANSALAADIVTNGDDEALLADIRTAITEFVNAGGNLTSTTKVNGSATLGDLLDSINAALNTEGDAARATAVKGVVDNLLDASNVDAKGNVVAPTVTTAPANPTAEKAINDALAQGFDRAELYEAADAAETAFETTVSGKLLVAAETIADAREVLNEKVVEAQEDLQEAQELSDAMDGFKAAHDGAVADLEEAQQYFIDNDLALPVVLDGLMTATEGNDIFIYNSEAATVNGFGLEGEDTIFFGEGFTLFDATGLDITKSGIGNADVLEILWQQVGNNVELYVEAQAFSGSVTGTDELTKVTLVGVNASELQDNLDNGQLSLGDLLA